MNDCTWLNGHLTEFEKSILDALPTRIAVLDCNGGILETNRGWRALGRETGFSDFPETRGVDYPAVLDGDPKTAAAAEAVRSVLENETEAAVLEYPVEAGGDGRRFYMRVTRVSDRPPCAVVVSFEDITPLKAAQAELELRRRNLEEANTTLKYLLRQRDADRRELEENVVENVETRTLTYIEDLKGTRLNSRQRACLEVVEAALREIVSPFIRNMQQVGKRLTPREIEVADLVRLGKASKEIADLLSVSQAAVDFHRKNIRRKLEIDRGTNLQSYLTTFS